MVTWRDLAIWGSSYPLALVPPIVVFVSWRLSRQQRAVLLVRGVIVLIVSVALAQIGGAIYHEPRPFVAQHLQPLIPHANDNGFPSDHTLATCAIALLLAPFSLPAGAATLLLAAVVGIARIGCHLHSVLDIAASFLFAGIANAVAWLAVRSRAARHP